jgi:hypothetical protein
MHRPWVGAHVTGCTGGSAGTIAPRAMWSETWRCRVGANQAVMARGIAGVVTACPMPPAAEHSTEGAPLTGSRGGRHDQQEQEEGEGGHVAPSFNQATA